MTASSTEPGCAVNRPGARLRTSIAAGLAATLAATALVLAAAPAAHAAGPEPGTPCTTDDLGKRTPFVEATITSKPEITHFTAFSVAPGNEGRDVDVEMPLLNVIQVSVLGLTAITPALHVQTLTDVEDRLSFQIQTRTASTNAFNEIRPFRFAAPGYYGVYKGAVKVTGSVSVLSCVRVPQTDGTTVLQWTRRQTGSYTTFGRVELGAIRCEDQVPIGSLREAVQRELGCFGLTGSSGDNGLRARLLASKTRQTAAKAGAKTAAKAAPIPAPTSVLPPGFTCDSFYSRILSANGLAVEVPDGEDGSPLRVAEWTRSTRQQWQVCKAAGTSEFVQRVFVNRFSDKCLQLEPERPDAPGADGTQVVQAPCNASTGQRVVLYRDLDPSKAVGIQMVSSGSMWAPENQDLFATIRQQSMGAGDGTGTFVLERI